MAKKKPAESKTVMTEPLFYLTNQYNLREILSGGFIGGRASFDDKYYEDLLVECPGWIPLLTEPVDASLSKQVNAHDTATSFTAILQIDPVKAEIVSSEEITGFENDGRPTLAGIACTGVITIKSVTAIHFLSAENRTEFEVRPYSNMPTPREIYKVSPELVQGRGDAVGILQHLRQLSKQHKPTAGDFSMYDRISGAISLCIYRSEGKGQSKNLLKLLDPSVTQKKAADIPDWFYSGFTTRTSKELFQLTDINDLVFSSTITILYSYGPNSVSQRQKILSQIRQLIQSHPGIAEQKETLDRSFTKIDRVLQLKDEFEPFKPGAGYDAIRGLLLFLMRPHHKELLSASTSELNASQPVMLTALVYSGIVIGRKGLEMEYRQADTEIAGLVATALNRIVLKQPKSQKGTGKATQAAAATMASRTMVSGDLVMASSMDVKTIQENVLNEKIDDPEFIAAAVRLCQEKGWANCVFTVVNWSMKDNFSIQPGVKSGLSLNLSGFPEISYELNFDQFKSDFSKLNT